MELAAWYNDHGPRPTQKLTREQATEVILHSKTRTDDRKYAHLFGVGIETVSEIRRGRSWRWLREEIRAGEYA